MSKPPEQSQENDLPPAEGEQHALHSGDNPNAAPSCLSPDSETEAEALPVSIRQLMLADIDEIMLIEPAAYGTHHWSRQSFINELTNPDGTYFGALDGGSGELLGYTGFWLIGDEAHITTLAVHPGLRRRKIGERLLVNSILEARKLGAYWLTLEVRVSNEAAQQLYYKYGFRSLGVRRRYYQDNSEDALVLWTDRLNDPEFIKRFAEQAEELGHDGKEAERILLRGEHVEEPASEVDGRATA